MNNQNEDLLRPMDVHETASLLGVPVSTVYQLFKNKEIKATLIGKRYKTNRAAINEYINRVMK